jgi:hypothetical protein
MRVPEAGVVCVVIVGAGAGVSAKVGEVLVENTYFVRGPSAVNRSEHPAMTMHPKIRRMQQT